MKPNRLLLLAFALLTPFVARAQLGAYAMFTESRLSGLQSSPLVLPGVTYNNSVNPSGFTGGVLYDFRNVGPVRLGVDARGSILHTGKGPQALDNGTGSVGIGTTSDNVLGGVRASFKTPLHALSPYAQVSAGLGRSDFGLSRRADGSLLRRNGFEYHAYAGLDIHVVPFFDYRFVELSYGANTTGGHTYPIESISTGIVFHLPRLP